MNPNTNNKRKKNQDSMQKIVIRCSVLHRPVYQHEYCTNYARKTASDTNKNCKNCSHSF